MLNLDLMEIVRRALKYIVEGVAVCYCRMLPS